MGTSWLRFETTLLDAARGVVGFGVNWLIQSTILIVAGLMIGRLLRHSGSAVQSAIYRTTLVAVLVCPVVSGLLSLGGISGWSLEMPAAWTYTDLGSMEPLAVRRALENRAVPPIASRESVPKANTDPVRIVPDDSANASGPAQPRSNALSPTTAAIETKTAALPVSETVPANAAIFEIHSFAIFALVFCALWAAITCLLLLRLAVAWAQLAQLRHCARKAEASTLETCREIASRLNVSVPEVLRSAYFPSPCLTGVFQPAILLPDANSNLKLPIRDVLAHELAHLRRRDCLWNWCWRCATSAFFFQPLLWRLARRLEATSEEVCDDYVVQLGGNRQEYAHQLVDIAELSCTPLSLTGVGIVSLRTMLALRVTRIMDTSRSLSTSASSLLLAVVLVGGLVGTFAVGIVGAGSGRAAEDEVPARAPEAQAAASALPEVAAKDEVKTNAPHDSKTRAPVAGEFRGRVVGADGKSVAGAKLYWFRAHFHDLRPMKPRLLATTNEAGEYNFVLPAESVVDPAEPWGWAYQQHLVVIADGHGFATTSPDVLRRQNETPGNALGALLKVFAGGSVPTIELPSSGHSIRGQIVDIDGKPVAGATVRIRWFQELGKRGPWSRGKDAPDEKTSLEEQVHDLVSVLEPEPLRHVLPSALTDDAGRFELRDVGAKRLVQLLVQGERIESTELIVRNVPGESLVVKRDRWSKEKNACTVYAREVLRAVGPSKPVVGRVVDLDTGKPISDAVVRVSEIHGTNLRSSREREEFATRTDADGQYRITGLPIGAENLVVAFTTGDVPYFPAGHYVDTSKGDSIEQPFRLKRGVWAEGRVFDAATNKPFIGGIDYYHFRDRQLEKEIPGLFRAYVDDRYWTNSNGEFRVPVLPMVRGILGYRYSGNDHEADGIDRFPRGAGATEIEGSEDLGGSRAFPTLPNYFTGGDYERVAEVRPIAGQATIRVDMPLVASKPVTIRVVDADGKPVSEFAVYGANERWGWQDKETTEFQVEDMLPKERRKIFVFQREGNLGGGAIVNYDEKQTVEVKLIKAGSVSGRLVDVAGEPITDATLTADYEKLMKDDSTAMWANGIDLIANPTNIPVDKKGRFKLDGLIPGWTYHAHASAPRKYKGNVTDFIIGNPLEGVKIEPGETKELGDLIVRDNEPK